MEPVCEIADNGIGISPLDFPKIFERFYRAENARQFRGSGVGLSLSQKILLLHNGKLSIQTELGKGTVVLGNFSTVSWGSGTYFLKLELEIGNLIMI